MPISGSNKPLMIRQVQAGSKSIYIQSQGMKQCPQNGASRLNVDRTQLTKLPIVRSRPIPHVLRHEVNPFRRLFVWCRNTNNPPPRLFSTLPFDPLFFILFHDCLNSGTPALRLLGIKSDLKPPLGLFRLFFVYLYQFVRVWGRFRFVIVADTEF